MEHLKGCDLIVIHLVKLQLKTAISRATARNDMATIRDALEVSAEMYKRDMNNVSDYVQRHLRSLSIWEELRYASSSYCIHYIFIFKTFLQHAPV